MRRQAVASLVAKGVSGLTDLLQSQLDDPVTRGAAVRGLARPGGCRTPRYCSGHYTRFDDRVRQVLSELFLATRINMCFLWFRRRHEVPYIDGLYRTIEQLSQSSAQRTRGGSGWRCRIPVNVGRLIDQYNKRRLMYRKLGSRRRHGRSACVQKTCVQAVMGSRSRQPGTIHGCPTTGTLAYLWRT